MEKISRRTVVAGLSAAGLLPLLPGIAFGQGGGTPKTGGTLKITHSTTIATLNVLQCSGPAEYPTVDMLYSGITRMAEDMTALPDLAESWEADPEATVFTFKLRPNVTFHDGTPFTSADVKATFDAILDPATLCPARPVLNMIESVDTPDDLTVVFNLSAPYADFPISAAHVNARIVPKAMLADVTSLNTKANGTGPFRLESYDAATTTRLVRFDDYYQDGKPYLDAVEMHLFPDLAAEQANYLSGAMDAMLDVQQANYAQIEDAPGSQALRTPAGRFVNVVMRQDQEPFDDVRVRQAMAYAIDRDLLVDIILEGLGRVANDQPISPGYRFHAETEQRSYDPERAKSLLAEAGFPDGLKLEMVCSNRPAIRSQVGIAIKQMALPAGFDIDVQIMPHDTYLANVWMKGKFYIGYWGMQPTEDAAFTLLFTSDAAFADTAWNNAEFDALVQKGRTTLDPEERAKIYAEAQRMMVEATPSVIPFFQDVLSASRDGVHGWSAQPLRRAFFLEDVWLDRA